MTSATTTTARPRPQRTPSVVGLGVARTRIELREFFRERDSMAQQRVALDQVEGWMAQRLVGA